MIYFTYLNISPFKQTGKRMTHAIPPGWPEVQAAGRAEDRAAGEQQQQRVDREGGVHREARGATPLQKGQAAKLQGLQGGQIQFSFFLP